MCLIIFAPNVASARIRKVILERGFRRNKDGAGLAYIKDGRIVLSKAYFEFAPFYLAYQRARSEIAVFNPTSPLLIHFRWGTCGPVNHVNTQPLTIYRSRLVMAHNGIFDNLSEADSPISDSVRLTHMIKRLGWNYPFDKAKTQALDTMCGRFSKLVFLSYTGRHTIINEKMGSWRRGAWYSDGGAVFDSLVMTRPRKDGKRETKIKQTGNPWMRREKAIPDGPTYVQMTPNQRKHFEGLTARARKLITQPDIIVDPDTLSDEDYSKWLDSDQSRLWRAQREVELAEWSSTHGNMH